MQKFVAHGFLEELRDEVAASSDLGYVVGENLTCGESPDPIQDFPALVDAERNRLTLYEAGGTLLRGGSRVSSERSVRFVVRGVHAQDSLNSAWRLVEWFENERRAFSLPSFVVRHLRTAVVPAVVALDRDGTALSQFAMVFHVGNKVTADG